MLYSCTDIATAGVKGVNTLTDDDGNILCTAYTRLSGIACKVH